MTNINLILTVLGCTVFLYLYYWLVKDYESPVDGSIVLADFPEEFRFGLATAPAHAEDHLNDSWIQWGTEGRIPFFKNIPQAAERLKTWSFPEIDIDLSAKTGIKLMRTGIDWGRLTPYKPFSKNCNRYGKTSETETETGYPCKNGVQNDMALKKYRNILIMTKSKGIRIMLTLFHHSLPPWANQKSFGGWTNVQILRYFNAFVQDVVENVKDLVDDYIVFNEPSIFANLVYGMSMWPGRFSDIPDYFAYWDFMMLKGTVVRAYEIITEAHKSSYEIIKSIDDIYAEEDSVSPARVGIAQYLGYYVPGPPELIMKPVADFVSKIVNYELLDKLMPEYLDFIGANFYGKEYVTTSGAAILSTEEYSEAGRAINPNGLVLVLNELYERYNLSSRNIPIVITENGISDETDVLRPSFFIEHLLAVKQALEAGINVEGYVFWTITDNMEWADGYCPKFGLYKVNRSSITLERTARPSAKLFTDIVTSRKIILQQRIDSWKSVKRTSGYRPFCRASDGRGTVENSTYRLFANKVDWRTSYKLDLFPKNPFLPFH